MAMGEVCARPILALRPYAAHPCPRVNFAEILSVAAVTAWFVLTNWQIIYSVIQD